MGFCHAPCPSHCCCQNIGIFQKEQCIWSESRLSLIVLSVVSAGSTFKPAARLLSLHCVAVRVLLLSQHRSPAWSSPAPTCPAVLNLPKPGASTHYTSNLQPVFSLMFLSDPFVKIQLVHGLKLTKTKKTSCMRGTIDPFYNESFSFKVPQEELENASLVFTGKCAAVVCLAWPWLSPR